MHSRRLADAIAPCREADTCVGKLLEGDLDCRRTDSGKVNSVRNIVLIGGENDLVHMPYVLSEPEYAGLARLRCKPSEHKRVVGDSLVWVALDLGLRTRALRHYTIPFKMIAGGRIGTS